MNYSRLAVAALGATVAYFIFGFLVFGLLVGKDFASYPAVYRSAEGIQNRMPIGIASTLVAIFVAAVIYAKSFQAGRGAAEGARFGMLVGIFSVCGFVLHNYVNLNIGVKLTLEQAAGYFAEWIVVGTVIGLIYRPAAAGH